MNSEMTTNSQLQTKNKQKNMGTVKYFKFSREAVISVRHQMSSITSHFPS